MAHDNPLITGADEILSALDNGPPDQTAIADMRTWIEQARTELQTSQSREQSLALLRGDIIARIAGMAKAIAVARNSEAHLSESAEMIQELEARSASELIATYRKLSARFRDTFRASFELEPLRRRRRTSRNSEVDDFK